MTRTLRLLSGLFLVLSLSVTSSHQASAQNPIMPERGLCAHRGDQALGPENTVPAFVGAAKAGAQQIELDVQKTKDGKLVIMHDQTVDRTTNGKGAVKDLTFDEIRSLDVVSDRPFPYEDIKVPTFEEALDCLPRNVWINVHIKPGEEGIAEDSLKIVMEKNRLHQAFFAAEEKDMNKLRAICPEVKICCMERQDNPEIYVQNTIKWKCDFIQFWGSYTKEQIAALKAANVKINYFGTDDPDEIRKLINDGIDYPLVNYFSNDWFATQEFDQFKLNQVEDEYLQVADSFLPPPKMASKGLCAHRGDQGLAPENTIPAFVAAAKAGAQQVEFDVQLTKDGKLVIMHDLTVDRTTTGKGNVKDLTFEEIRSFDAGVKYDPKFAGLQVPTFEEALDCLPRNIWINIHIKPGEGIAAAATKVVVEKGRLAQSFIGCENKKDIDDARSVCPNVKIAFLNGKLSKELVEKVISWNCQFIQFTGYDAECISILKKAGITTNYFGTDDPEKIKTLLKDGVDFPLVNYFTKDWPAAAEIEGLELNALDPNYTKETREK